MSRTSAEEAEADGTASGGWLGAVIFGVLEEGWLFGSAKTAESATTRSGAAMPWMEAARARTNTITMPALDCFILPIIQVNTYLHKPTSRGNVAQAQDRGTHAMACAMTRRSNKDVRYRFFCEQKSSPTLFRHSNRSPSCPLHIVVNQCRRTAG